MSRVILLFAAASYLAFIASSVWMIAFLLGVDLGRTFPNPIGWPIAAAIDLGLIALFGVVHSVMSRPGFKRHWTRVIPPAAERAFYVLQSSCLLGLIFWQWRPISREIWHLEGWGAGLMLAAFAFGVAVIVLATFLLDHLTFTGVRQAWTHLRHTPMPRSTFRQPLLYRYVRHPLQSGILITLFAVPSMTVDGLLFAGAMTIYILVGLRFEERALLREFGDQYRVYRSEVPMLIPRIGVRRRKEGTLADA